MIPAAWRAGEVAIVGLGKSGVAASMLLVREGIRVYASDAGTGEAAQRGAGALTALGAHAETGGHDLDRIARAVLVVASPGVPPDVAALARARSAGVPVVSEIEVGLRVLDHVPYIAVTGTNGKTTTTALVGHLLRGLGYDAVDAGNIGTPVTEVALRAEAPAWMAIELSSFQLHDTPGIAPDVGVLTNLAPDHLDRYASVEEYYADKALLFRNAGPQSKWVVNYDDPAAMGMIARVAGEHGAFSTRAFPPLGDMYYHAPGSHAAGSMGSAIFWRHERLISRDELHLLGDHNVANAMAAALAVLMADPEHQSEHAVRSVAAGRRTFRALPHRLEPVGEFDGISWINDSKATNVSSAKVAIEGMVRPAIVLLGGRHKGEPYTSLVEPLRAHAKAVIAYGEAAPLVEADLGAHIPIERLGSDFEAVIARARALATRGDVVLLSPACSSYDMFENYEERGAAFRRLAAGPA